MREDPRELSQQTNTMLQTGLLNPHVLDLIARIRHTNTLVISDWAFPYWPEIETVDISLTHGIPTVLDVLDLLEQFESSLGRRRLPAG